MQFLHKLFGNFSPPVNKLQYDSKTEGFAFQSQPAIWNCSQKTQEERYVASLMLASAGDCLGYKKGLWEFTMNGELIHEELKKLTDQKGLSALKIQLPDWPASDDTIMMIASCQALVDTKSKARTYLSFDEFGSNLAKEYIECWKLMHGRAAGKTCGEAIFKLNQENKNQSQSQSENQNQSQSRRSGKVNWQAVPFSSSHGGCGAAMRASAFGLMYPDLDEKKQLDRFIQVVVESGRMTHHLPTGYLGAIASAYFTSLALQGVPLVRWGFLLLKLISQVKEYIKKAGREVKKNLDSFDYFVKAWEKHLALRGILNGEGPLLFPTPYTVKDRDVYYKSISFDGWGGASGHDVGIIAYDALLGCEGSWEELCSRACMHAGDSDSTGTLAGAWYGALVGFLDVPSCNYVNLEFAEKLTSLGKSIHQTVFETVDTDRSVKQKETCLL